MHLVLYHMCRWSTSLSTSTTANFVDLKRRPTRQGHRLLATASLLGDRPPPGHHRLLPPRVLAPLVAWPSSKSDRIRSTPAFAPPWTRPITWPRVTCSLPLATSSNCASSREKLATQPFSFTTKVGNHQTTFRWKSLFHHTIGAPYTIAIQQRT